MFKTARIAVVLALVPLLVATPARALSVKDWAAKSNRDQILYVTSCLAKLVIAVGKTDQPLAQKIRSYYGDKQPGMQYPQGMYDLFTNIAALERQAKTDSRVDLSSIEIEDIIFRVTAQKFALPDAAADAVKDSGTVTSTRKNSPAQPATAPRTDASPARSATNAAHPIMVGKIDVSHFAGLKPGDTPQQVVSIYGQPTEDRGTYQFWGNSSGPLMVTYSDNVVSTVELYSNQVGFLRAHGTNDALVDLIGQKEPAVVALLGQPTDAWEEYADKYDLYWTFHINGRPAPEHAHGANGQTLTLRFKRINPPQRVHGIRQDDADCIWVSVTW
jgi:hypothetical protein